MTSVYQTVSIYKRPWANGKRSTGITRKHEALVWECMLGAVYARNEKGQVSYFDYDYRAAHEFAKTAECSDLRIARNKLRAIEYPRTGQLALFGIRARE